MGQIQDFEVIIVGGGPVGMTLALALVQSIHGIRVAMVDRRQLSVPHDARASAIAAGARRVFEALGVWSAMADEAQPITAMRITDSGAGDMARPLFLTFSGDDVLGEALAYMVPNRVSTKALLEAVEDRISIIAPANIIGYTVQDAFATLALEDGSALKASLLVAADGRQSALRGMAGIGVTGHDYHQNGLVTNITHALPHNSMAYEHFRPAGPFASLPLRGKRSSLVWTENNTNARRFLAMDMVALAREIEVVMGSNLGEVILEEPVMAFPLHLQIARDFVAPRLALIGDAAHVVHPIAGQGLNLGLKDVAALAEVVVDALRLGLDHGEMDVLTRYQRWRRFDTTSMAAMTDGLNRLFSNDIAPIRALRDIGLGLVDRTKPVKSALIQAASGISHGGPKLLSGLPI